jgi:hypothetical protein
MAGCINPVRLSHILPTLEEQRTRMQPSDWLYQLTAVVSIAPHPRSYRVVPVTLGQTQIDWDGPLAPQSRPGSTSANPWKAPREAALWLCAVVLATVAVKDTQIEALTFWAVRSCGD